MQKSFYELIEKINLYYSIQNTKKYGSNDGWKNVYYNKLDKKQFIKKKSLFIVSNYTAKQLSEPSNLINLCNLKLKILLHNFSEIMKGFLCFRPSIYENLKVINLNYEGTTSIDFKYGTAIVISEKYVDKFFFKDINYFIYLYKNIDLKYIIDIQHNSLYLAIRQIKYDNSRNYFLDYEVLKLVKKLSMYLKNTNLIQLNKMNFFSVSYKIKQLFNAYEGNINNASEYLKICSILESRVANFQQTLCHGDLSQSNIVRDNNYNLVAIDFDKIVFFCHCYDLIYFYLITKVLPKIKLKNILINIEKYSHEIDHYFNKDMTKSYEFSLLEIKYCVFLFVFIKLVERDLFEKCFRKNIELLLSTLNEL